MKLWKISLILLVLNSGSVFADNHSTAPAQTSLHASTETNVNAIADSNAQQLRTLPTQAADQRTQQILNSLAKQAGWFPKVKIIVKDGMVTVKGSAQKSQQVDWLVKTAERLPGVIAVINQTNIETPPLTDLTPAREEFKGKIEQAKKYLPLLIFAIVLLSVFVVLGIYLSKLTRKLWSTHISNPFLLATVSRLTMLPVWALFFFLTLKAAGLSALATTIVGGTGAASIILGFAFKGIAENYLSGLLLAIRSPFTKGDEIQVDQYAGFVQSLNMRGTTILDYDGNVVLIPNAIVIQSVIRNKTVNSRIRGSFILTIAYSDSINRAIELIQKVLGSVPEVLQKPAPGVSVDKLSAAGIDLGVSFWFDASKTDGGHLKSVLVAQIKDLLISNSFHIPDAAREIVFSDALKIHLMKSVDDTVENGQNRLRSIQKKAAEDLKRIEGVPVDKGSKTQDIRSLGKNISLLRKTTDSDLLEAG